MERKFDECGVEMETFHDTNGAKIRFEYQQNAFGREPEHVLVICRYLGKWLLTNHKQRGWEFPGGKKEQGETIIEAAAREVSEETGGSLQSLQFVGEYQVENKATAQSFIKAVFFAEVENLTKHNHYYETNGPIFETGNILMERFKNHYSYIMKDEVIRLSIKRLQTAGLL